MSNNLAIVFLMGTIINKNKYNLRGPQQNSQQLMVTTIII